MNGECVCVSDPLWLDLMWSAFGLLVGVIVGYIIRDKRDKE